MKCLCGRTTPLLFEGKWCGECFNRRETPAVREIESEADKKEKRIAKRKAARRKAERKARRL